MNYEPEVKIREFSGFSKHCFIQLKDLSSSCHDLNVMLKPQVNI